MVELNETQIAMNTHESIQNEGKLIKIKSNDDEDQGFANSQFMLTEPAAKESPKLSQDSCELISKSNKSTAYNTTADISLMDIDEDDDPKNDPMVPYPDFNWKTTVYPESNVVDLAVQQYGKTIQLSTYRWAPKNERKGVVFYIHGYGSFANHNAVYGKYLAQADYEVFSVD